MGEDASVRPDGGVGSEVDAWRVAAAAVVDDALAVDFDALSDDDLDSLVVAMQEERARMAIAAAEAISAWDRRAVWKSDGSRSAAHRLARTTHCALASGRRELNRARRLSEMPHTREAVLERRLSMDHVDLFGEASSKVRAGQFAAGEEGLIEAVSPLPFWDAVKVVKYWIRHVDAVLADEDGQRQDTSTHLHMSATIDGVVVVSGELDPINGAIVSETLETISDELRLADKRDGVVRTASQRRAAALVEMARRSRAVPEGARMPAPLFTVLVGEGTLAELCELSTGVVVTPGQVGHWADPAMLEVVLFDGPSTVLSVSKRRRFTGAVRRAIEVRDKHCQHRSGCDIPAIRCDVDHIVPFTVRRDTSQFNGKLECTPHNRNAELHDHGEQPLPPREVTRLDEVRAKLIWRLKRELNRQRGEPDDADDDDSDSDERAAS